MISGLNTTPTRYRPAAVSAAPASSGLAPARDTLKPVVQAGGGVSATSLLDTVKGWLTSIMGFFSGLWNKLLGKGGTTAPVDDSVKQIAAQYGLLVSKANVDAFVAEVQGYAQPGPGGYQTMGPGCPNVDGVKSIQTALKGWGYAVDVTGQYDAATQNEVKAFKRDNGLHQTYQLADSSYAINEYLDYQTFQKMQAKATGTTGTTGTTTTPPANTGTSNWQAIAAQYHLQADAANVNAFLAEVASYQRPDANGFQVMGPGFTNQAQVKQVQAILAKAGYQVSATGTWDAATIQAIMAFKAKYGIHQNYRSADGNWAVNEYADLATLQKLSTL